MPLAIDAKGKDIVASVVATYIQSHLLFQDAVEVEVGVENGFFVIDRRDEIFAIGRDDGAAAIEQERLRLVA